MVGNALSRGNAAIEWLLDKGLSYTSGPQWLGEQVLASRQVLAVAGTHGKTTTSSLLTFLLDAADLEPGFLIGGVPRNFGLSARLGQGATFVVEADEYDTAFFDKRSKFVHYRPHVAILNNLEFEHADIFPDLAAIQRQFHHLVRTVPGNGRLIVNGVHAALLAPALAEADVVVFLQRPELAWKAQTVIDALQGHGLSVSSVDALIDALLSRTHTGDHVVFMSNGGFEGAQQRFLAALSDKHRVDAE